METNNSLVIALIEHQGVGALRVGFTVVVIVFLLAGVFIWRRRHQFFDRDSNVENDVPVFDTIVRRKSCLCGAV